MSDANKQLVRDFLAAFYAGDVAGALATCDDDIQFVVNAPIEFFPHFGPRHGKTDVAETWRALHARYASMRHEVPFLIADDSRAAAIINIFFRKSAAERVEIGRASCRERGWIGVGDVWLEGERVG